MTRKLFVAKIAKKLRDMAEYAWCTLIVIWQDVPREVIFSSLLTAFAVAWYVITRNNPVLDWLPATALVAGAACLYIARRH